MHFANGREGYAYSDRVAKSIASGEGYTETQLTPDMRQWLSGRTKLPLDTPRLQASFLRSIPITTTICSVTQIWVPMRVSSGTAKSHST